MANNLVQKIIVAVCSFLSLVSINAYNHLNIFNQLPDDEVTVVVTHIKRGILKSNEELARLNMRPKSKQVIPLKDEVLTVRVDFYYPAIIQYRGSEIDIGSEKKSYGLTVSFEADKPGQTKSLIVNERTLKLDQGKQGQEQCEQPVISAPEKVELKKTEAEVVGAGAGTGAGVPRRAAGPIVKATPRLPQTQEQAAKAPESARISRMSDFARPQVTADTAKAAELAAARKALNEKRERDAEKERQLADWSSRAEMYS